MKTTIHGKSDRGESRDLDVAIHSSNEEPLLTLHIYKPGGVSDGWMIRVSAAELISAVLKALEVK